jgi:predicted pyridoxine 5'-phosphate oxidase superfamily flavin-nucleotide-binding protein
MKLNEDIIDFFQHQSLVIVTTIDSDGTPHNSCKGIVQIDENGTVYLFDLYLRKTFENLKVNPNISIAAADEHRFTGYCLKGKAHVIHKNAFPKDIIKKWEQIIAKRITRRLIKTIGGEKGHIKHPEAHLPKPEYMIVMKVEHIIDLTPYHVRQIQ